VEFAVKKGATVLVNDKIEEKHSALDNPQLIRLRKAYYPKHFSTDRLCLYNLVVDKANSQIKLTIHLTKHTYDESIVGERSADWSPHGGGYTKKKCQRDLLWEKNHGLPELTDMGLTNTIGVSAWILSADEILIVTQRAEEGLHSNVGSLSISASAGADWCDRLEFSGNRLDGKVPDDSTLVDCKRLVMAAVV
jgi:hypothetical protein